ncbi:hypothetical protein D3C75_185180 [compost metagenome]
MKKLIKPLLLALIVSGLVGCSSEVPGGIDNMSTVDAGAKSYVETHSPMKGESKEQCDLMWKRAQHFVTTKSDMKMERVTDSEFYTKRLHLKFPGRKAAKGGNLVLGDKCEIDVNVKVLDMWGFNEDYAFMAELIKYTTK